jgi:hypothetical protein
MIPAPRWIARHKFGILYSPARAGSYHTGAHYLEKKMTTKKLPAKRGRPDRGLSDYGNQAAKYKNSTFRLGKFTDGVLDEMSRALGVSRSQVVRHALYLTYQKFLAGMTAEELVGK